MTYSQYDWLGIFAVAICEYGLYYHEIVRYEGSVSSLPGDSAWIMRNPSTLGCLDALYNLETNSLQKRCGRSITDPDRADDYCRITAGLGRHMRDLTQRDGSRALYVGLAFEIADLGLVKRWADRHKFRISIRLDYGVAVGEEFEEVIAFQTTKSPLYRFVMWRDAERVFVQPLVGRQTQHGSVTEALARAITN